MYPQYFTESDVICMLNYSVTPGCATRRKRDDKYHELVNPVSVLKVNLIKHY